ALAGYVIDDLKKKQKLCAAKTVMIIAVVILVGLLGWYKYAGFVSENLRLLGLGVPALRIALPIGISFYTFQIVSYVIDVWRGTVKPPRRPVDFAAFISMFSQLIAGPIVRYSDVEQDLIHPRRTDATELWLGVRRFIVGLSKKILLANAMANICDVFRASDDKSVLFYWIYAVSLALYIYFDFSGYSDMAIGIGRMLGFSFPENFNYPYLSRSLTEFWRRWHMTLGSWFRDYIYIPMGGNRVKKIRWVFNLAVVWALTGLWHGAAWNFVLWGLFFAVLLPLEKQFYMDFLNRHRVLSHIYALVFILVSFVIFNADSVKMAGVDIAGMFGAGVPMVSPDALYCLKSNGLLLCIAVFAAMPVAKNWVAKQEEKAALTGKVWVIQSVLCALALIVCTAYLVDGSFNPFLYFRF
ncbi:MAG: MBOAT family protein, partial [Clostridia bacterium]|nr:MBOAT family protein [Clostridia bacterium]